MGFRDLLRKKDQLSEHEDNVDADTASRLAAGAPEFTLIRSDTHTHEPVHPPSHGSYDAPATAAQEGFLTTADAHSHPNRNSHDKPHHHHSRLSLRSRSRSVSASSIASATSLGGAGGGNGEGGSGGNAHLSPGGDHTRRRLSQRLGLRRAPPSSENVPLDLPEIQVVAGGGDDPTSPDAADPEAREAIEAQWEKRATILAQSRNRGASMSVSVPGSTTVSPGPSPAPSPTPMRSPISPISPLSPMSTFGGGNTPAIDNGRFTPFRPGAGNQKPTPPPLLIRSQSQGHGAPLLQQPRSPMGPPPPRSPQLSPSVPPESREERERRAVQERGQAIDLDIQEAIRLHEAGSLEMSTRLFGRLADPAGANNPLSQVLYGLALRHGWGCQADPAGAVRYLSQAASNAAVVEQLALQAGLKKGGAAKGELVLAIFELANCFRHGWGIERDPIAAKQYYETAANLGDTDAMNEVAWCYLEGFGCKKDRFAAARYYRLAEKNGSKTLGNTWIWKEKYDPGADGKKKKKI